MLLELSLAITLGIFFGTISGLIPGIHINLIGAILLSLTAFLLGITSPTILIVFIVSMAITHTFIDFIPSIFLGAPDEDTVLSILPGHELLKKGRGYEAITLATLGSFSALPIILIMSIIFILILTKISPIINFLIPYLLIMSSIFLISQENKKLTALVVFILSGFLGVIVLNSNIEQPFLPLLSGLFGASSLIISIKTKPKIEKQKITKTEVNYKELKLPLLASLIAAPLTSFLPGLGSGQAAVLGTSFKQLSKRQFLILLGATNTIVLGLSFIVFFSIGRTRTGMAVVVSQITNNITIPQIFIIIATILFTGIICYYWTLCLAKHISKQITKIPYSILSITILLVLTIIVAIFSNPLGFLAYLVATSTGIFGILSNVRRINLMGSIILPVILFYLI